jgi:hypothetical protein
MIEEFAKPGARKGRWRGQIPGAVVTFLPLPDVLPMLGFDGACVSPTYLGKRRRDIAGPSIGA